MEIPYEEKQGLELEDSPDFEIPDEKVEDEPQMQANLESQKQDVKKETRNEQSVGSTGNETKSVQPTVEKCDEAMLYTQKKPNGSAGLEHEVTGECKKIHQESRKRKRDSIPDTAHMMQPTEEASEPSDSSSLQTLNLPLGKFIEMVLDKKPSKPTESLESISRIEPSMRFLYKLPNVPETEKNVKDDKPEQELQVEQAEQAVALVSEEAVVCHASPEQMEVVEDIEDPQKYAFKEKDVE